MCGICGMLDLKKEYRVDKLTIVKMVDAIKHRGPDDMDYYIKENLALGFARLSIIDLQGGMQPIKNEDETILLVCNGEIFNYIELRDHLITKGHRFRSNTDIEVILHLYEEYGTDFVNSLNGQFAFAIYDTKNKLLFCARDHTGIAPFYYTIANGMFLFASEIKAIIEYPEVRREVDVVSLDQILSFPGMISPRTLFKNINSLESGHHLLVTDSGRLEVKEYWDLIYPKTNEIEYKSDERYYIEKLDELITKSVKYRLQADVPVGFYISGGLDSSIIASKINSLCPEQKRNSFSIDFPERRISEAKYQRMMANNLNTIHHETLFEFSDISSRLKKVVRHSEAALKESYNAASMALSESVKNENIKVVLTGEGADELFGGYVGYSFDKIRQAQASDSTYEALLENELRRELWGDESFLYEKNYHAYRSVKRELYSDHINEIFDKVDCFNLPVIKSERVKDIDLLHKRSYIDFKLRLPEHLLGDHGDRMCFANSVEARYPFLDKDLIEFTKTIPPYLKLKDFNEKYILKKMAHNQIPKEIINRTKFAFVAPGSPDILKQGDEYILDLLSYEKIKKQGYFNPDKVEELKKQYLQDSFKLNLPFESDMLITVITFGIFIEEFCMPSYR